MTTSEAQRLMQRVEAARNRATDARATGDYAGAAIAAGDARRYLRRIITDQRAQAEAR